MCRSAESYELEIKSLRDALEKFGEHSSDCESGYEKRIAEGYARMTTGKSCTCGFSSAINQPSDDTALEAYVEAMPEMKLLDEIGVLLNDVEYKGSYAEGIKALLALERERCIEAVRTLDDGPPIGKWDSGYIVGLNNAIAAIRALGD